MSLIIRTSSCRSLLLALLLLAGCRTAPPAGEQDGAARRLLSDLNAGTDAVASVHASGSRDLRQYQPLPDFARTVADLNRRIGRLQSVTRQEVRVTRSMAQDKTSLVYRVSGDRGQEDVKVYLLRERGRWILDGLRVGETPP